MTSKNKWLVIGCVTVTLALAGAASFYVAKMRKAVSKTKADMTALEKGLSAFYFAQSRYPTEQEGLEAGIKAWALVQCSQTSSPQTCMDMPRKSPPDAWGRAYRYRSDGPKHAVLTSAGPDGEFDTSDDLNVHSPASR